MVRWGIKRHHHTLLVRKRMFTMEKRPLSKTLLFQIKPAFQCRLIDLVSLRTPLFVINGAHAAEEASATFTRKGLVEATTKKLLISQNIIQVSTETQQKTLD